MDDAMTIRGTKSGIPIRGALRPADRVGLDVVARQQYISGGTSETVTNDDGVFEAKSASVYDILSDASLRMDHPDACGFGLTFWTSEPSIATVDAYGRLTRVSSGPVRIFASNANGYVMATPLISVSQVSSGGTLTWTGWATGSLAKHVSDGVAALVDGLTPETVMPMFSSYDHAAGTYTYNAARWCSSVDLTCWSPWNATSSPGGFVGGTAVSPRHVLYCKHWTPPHSIGRRLRFVAADNTVIERQVAAYRRLDDSDIAVVQLNEDLPVSITPAKICPANMADILARIYSPLAVPTQIPMLAMTQYGTAAIRALMASTSGLARWVPSSTLGSYYVDAVGGDSGSPSFLLINGQAVLYTLNTSSVTGPDISQHATAINAAMTALGGGYQLQAVDVSDFTNFNS